MYNMTMHKVRYDAHGRAKCGSREFPVKVIIDLNVLGCDLNDAKNNGLVQALLDAPFKLLEEAQKTCEDAILLRGYIPHNGTHQEIVLPECLKP